MSIQRVSFTPTVAPADGGGGGATGGWQTTTHGDLTLNQGSYGMTYAAGQNGFAHRITIDTAASSRYFDRSVMGYLYLDLQKTVTQLRDAFATNVSILIKCSITAGDAKVTDAGAEFHFGPAITWGPTISASKDGGYFSGIICKNATGNGMFRRPSVTGRIVTDSTLGTGTALFQSFNNGATDDVFEWMQFSGTGMYGNPRGAAVAGFTGGDMVWGFKTAAGARFHDLNEAHQLSTQQNSQSETAHVGVCFGQYISNAGLAQSKTLDFDFSYFIESSS